MSGHVSGCHGLNDPQACICPDEPEDAATAEDAMRLTREDRYTYAEWKDREGRS